MITYRDLKSREELAALNQLEMRAWQTPTDEATPHYIMKAIQHCGGCVLGAFEGDTMIGFSFGFPAQETGLLWSHMSAIDPVLQGQNLGFDLKQAQRRWALERGYTQIGWTFDPFARRNARFNIHKLAVQVVTYHENFYGEMTDALNVGLPSDRLNVRWHLNDDRVIANATGNIQQPDYALSARNTMLQYEKDMLFVYPPEHWSEYQYRIEIPYHTKKMKSEQMPLLQQWQNEFREMMQAGLAAGYQVRDFILTENERCFYILQRSS